MATTTTLQGSFRMPARISLGANNFYTGPPENTAAPYEYRTVLTEGNAQGCPVIENNESNLGLVANRSEVDGKTLERGESVDSSDEVLPSLDEIFQRTTRKIHTEIVVSDQSESPFECVSAATASQSGQRIGTYASAIQETSGLAMEEGINNSLANGETNHKKAKTGDLLPTTPNEQLDQLNQLNDLGYNSDNPAKTSIQGRRTQRTQFDSRNGFLPASSSCGEPPHDQATNDHLDGNGRNRAISIDLSSADDEIGDSDDTVRVRDERRLMPKYDKRLDRNVTFPASKKPRKRRRSDVRISPSYPVKRSNKGSASHGSPASRISSTTSGQPPKRWAPPRIDDESYEDDNEGVDGNDGDDDTDDEGSRKRRRYARRLSTLVSGNSAGGHTVHRRERRVSSTSSVALSVGGSTPPPNSGAASELASNATTDQWQIRGILRRNANDVYTIEFAQDLQPSLRVGPTKPPQKSNPKFTDEEDALLIELKKRRKLPWKQIGDSFPGRSVGSLQVRYSTKLKDR